ncbi:MAG: phenylalanine--tRNA ligase subunit alpha, partial [Terriglobia bacterium]
MGLQQDIEELREGARKTLSDTQSLEDLDKVRVDLLGRKGKLTSMLKMLSSLPEAERPVVGKVANEVRDELERLIRERKKVMSEQVVADKIEEDKTDITLPGRHVRLGSKHLISQISEEIMDFFSCLGYGVAEGPEIESDYYNFEALNIPADHPARSLMDTFYVSGKH